MAHYVHLLLTIQQHVAKLCKAFMYAITVLLFIFSDVVFRVWCHQADNTISREWLALIKRVLLYVLMTNN
jgi:hypothetical protein